jgi:transcription antitermination factor NusG
MEKGKTYHWHVIYTRSRQEKMLARSFEENGIIYYLPIIKTLKQWSDRMKQVEEVLFKSYIFVYVSEREYYEALKAPGAVKYISFNGKAAKIPDNQIETIKNTINNKIEFSVNQDIFKKGEKVEIINGPLCGSLGEVVLINGKKKLLIRIEQIGYSLLVHISGDAIRLVV